MTKHVLLLCGVLFFSACPQAPEPGDAGPGPFDAGARDAGLADAGSLPDDAGTTMGPPTIAFRRPDGGLTTDVYLLDEVAVTGRGFPPDSEVTLEAQMTPWRSTATYLTAADGTFDGARDAPVRGDFSGVDPDGFFWSMDTADFQVAASADVSFVARVDGAPAAFALLHRSYRLPGVTEVQPDAGFVGIFYVPPGAGPFPTFLAFGGSEGGLSGGQAYAQDLVPLGVAVLAVAYFGAPGVPAGLENIPLEYFQGPLDWLRARPEVDLSRLGVIGGSRGGELALLLASRHPEFSLVVADSPSGYVWGSAQTANGLGWTEHDAGVFPVPSLDLAPVLVTTASGQAYSFRSGFETMLAQASPADLERARITIERSPARVAMFAGEADALWPSCPMAGPVLDAQADAGLDAGSFLVCFPDAGHAVGVVGLPTKYLDSSGGQFPLALGGDAAGAAHAGRQRLRRLRALVDAW